MRQRSLVDGLAKNMAKIELLSETSFHVDRPWRCGEGVEGARSEGHAPEKRIGDGGWVVEVWDEVPIGKLGIGADFQFRCERAAALETFTKQLFCKLIVPRVHAVRIPREDESGKEMVDSDARLSPASSG